MTQIEHAVTAAQSQLDALVYFGHGWPSGMASADIYNRSIPAFADLIRKKCAMGVKVTRSACLRGAMSAPGGRFAARLARELVDVQAEALAIENAGHTTANPNVFRFVGVKPPMSIAPAGRFTAFDRMLKAETIDK